MQEKIRIYYSTVRISNVIFVAISLVFFVGSMIMYWRLKGSMSYMFMVGNGLFSIGIFGVGFYRFLRSFSRYKNIQERLSDTHYIRNEELPNVQQSINKVFAHRRTELVIVVLSFFSCIYGAIVDNGGWVGTSAAICLMISYILSFDLYRQFIDLDYERTLQKLVR